LDVLGAAEIELRVLLLPPISRGERAGPRLHAERLIECWKAEGEVPLGETFRLLVDVETVAGVILRATMERDERDDCRRDLRYWHFPPFPDLLPGLREAVWQAALAGRLVLEAIKGVRGKRHHPLAPVLLPRLTPDWELARLVDGGGRDEWIDVRVRRMPATDIARPWQSQKPTRKELEVAARNIAKAYPPPAQLSLKDWWAKLKAVHPKTSRQQAEDALKEAYASHLRLKPGQRSKNNPPS
jgi:hypothetical protein